jgi:hypothetical protein
MLGQSGHRNILTGKDRSHDDDEVSARCQPRISGKGTSGHTATAFRRDLYFSS